MQTNHLTLDGEPVASRLAAGSTPPLSAQLESLAGALHGIAALHRGIANASNPRSIEHEHHAWMAKQTAEAAAVYETDAIKEREHERRQAARAAR
jgi:hypothetical protein